MALYVNKKIVFPIVILLRSRFNLCKIQTPLCEMPEASVEGSGRVLSGKYQRSFVAPGSDVLLLSNEEETRGIARTILNGHLGNKYR